MRLLIVVSSLALVAACGPVGPMDASTQPSQPGGGSGQGDGSGGGSGGSSGGGGVTVTSTPPGAPPPSGGQTTWAHKMGGLGIEYTQDVGVAGDGSIVAFNVIGVRGESLEQIGFVHIDASGNETDAQFENENGAALHFAPAGNFAIEPDGTMVVAAAGRCAGGTCPTIGGRPVDGGAVVGLSSRATFSWQARLPGDVASNLDVDGRGDLLVVAQGGVARALRGDGSVTWERSGFDASAPCAAALDGAGGGFVGCGDEVTRLDARGAAAWRAPLAGVTVLAVRAASSGVVVHGRYRSSVTLGGTTLTAPSGADHGYFLAQLAADGTPRWARDLGVVEETSDGAGPKTLLAVGGDGTIALVTGADACTAAVATFDAGGAPRWRRSLAVNGCGGRDLVVHGLAIAPTRQILIGGAMSAPIDFGSGTLNALATDAFVVSLSP